MIAVSCHLSAISEAKLNIFNVNGKIVKKLTATDSRPASPAGGQGGQLIAGTTWNASNLPCGLYLIKLKTSGKTYTHRIVLQR